LKGNFETIQADERMLKQAILNLLRNAAEAIPTKQKHRFVTVSARKDKEFAVLEIEDTGKGIAEEDLANIFVPFFTTKAKGHGIGLALAHRVISQHNGVLTASNSKNSGAIFTVKLPIFPDNDLNNNNFLNVD
jgi:signal transduction histidine kinase